MRSRRTQLKYEVWLIVGVVLILLLLPLIIRFILVGTPLGYESYYHHRLGKDILQHGFSAMDAFVPERTAFFTPFHVILAGFQFLIGNMSMYLSLIFGIANTVILYYLLTRLGFQQTTRTIILLLYVSSPLFLWSSWFLTPSSAVLFFQLLGIWFFITKGNKKWLAVLFYSLASLFGVVHLLINSFFVLYWFLSKKENKNVFFSIITVNGALFLFYYLPRILFSYGGTNFPQQFLVEFLTDFGGITGFSIFLIILAFFGLVRLRKQRKLLFYLIGVLLIFMHSYVSSLSRIYTNLLFCIFGGMALHDFMTRKWYFNGIRNLFLLLVIFGLLFSSLSFISIAVSYQPSTNMHEGFSWLNLLEEDALIFSHYSNGFWIQDLGERRAYLDAHPLSYPSFGLKIDHMEAIMHSYDLKKTREMLQNQGITHILLIEGEEAPGLQFLLENNETFKKVYSSTDVTVWRFLENGRAFT